MWADTSQKRNKMIPESMNNSWSAYNKEQHIFNLSMGEDEKVDKALLCQVCEAMRVGG